MRKISLPGYLLLSWLGIFLLWWFFALSPLPETSPEWVEAARKVCFGALPNGLPEGYGWITLVCSPLLVLTALVVIWSDELFGDLQYLWRQGWGRFVLIFLLLIPFCSVSWGVHRVLELMEVSALVLEAQDTPEELPENYPHFEGPAPKFQLLNQDGEAVTVESFRGRRFILTFAFSHCSATCPGLVHTVKAAAETFDGPRPAVVIVTLDPWRDTPSALPSLYKKWQLKEPDQVLSGSIDEVQAVIKAYKISNSRDLKSGDIVHSGMAFLFDEKGTLVYQFSSPSVRWLRQGLERL